MALPTSPITPDDAKRARNEVVDDGLDVTLSDKEQSILRQVRLDEKDDLNKPKSKTSFYEISFEDLMENDYDKSYGKFNAKLEMLTGLIQDNLQETGQSYIVAQGRKERSEALLESKKLINSLATKFIIERNMATGIDAEILASLATNDVCGLGPIEPLWENPKITEIMVNGHNRIRIEIGGKLMTVPGAQFRNDRHLEDLCSSILSNIGRTFDISNPFEDGRLPDGSRINATYNTIGDGHTNLTIRRFRAQAYSMKDLQENGAMNEEILEFLGNMVYHGSSILIAGPTGSGKTTVLNALSGCIPEGERVLTIEDNIEMTLNPKKDVVKLEANKNASIRDLVRNALRMRPDRIIVGEVRDSAAYDMLQAMNTGHDGSMTTVHANDAFGAIDRVVNLLSEVGDVNGTRALSIIAGGIDLIVCIDRYEDGSRRIAQIAEVPKRIDFRKETAVLEPVILWEFSQTNSDKEGKVEGTWLKVKNLSDGFIKRKRIDKKEHLDVATIYKISEHY